MVRPGPNDHSAGFLLIEVAVALAIVALAFGYAFRSLSGAIDRLGRDHNAAAALLLAQSTIDRVGYDIALGQGDVSGNTKDGYSWSIETLPYASGTSPVATSLVGYVVRVTVGWQERNAARQIRLSTVRLAYRGSG
jgi:type II secretory pathway pseudopilin PulG